MINYTKSLNKEDIELLHTAIPLLDELWGPHGIHENTGFVEGDDHCTIWIHLKSEKNWRYYNNNGVKTFISVIEKYMSDFFNHRHLKIRRSYIHRIKPGKEIPKHVDDNDQPYFLVCKRYQLFINIPNNVIIESVPKAKENTFFWFDHNKFHYYKNNSNEDLIFCVVDTTPR